VKDAARGIHEIARENSLSNLDCVVLKTVDEQYNIIYRAIYWPKRRKELLYTAFSQMWAAIAVEAA
jgi:hypothetical protein